MKWPGTQTFRMTFYFLLFSGCPFLLLLYDRSTSVSHRYLEKNWFPIYFFKQAAERREVNKYSHIAGCLTFVLLLLMHYGRYLAFPSFISLKINLQNTKEISMACNSCRSLLVARCFCPLSVVFQMCLFDILLHVSDSPIVRALPFHCCHLLHLLSHVCAVLGSYVIITWRVPKRWTHPRRGFRLQHKSRSTFVVTWVQVSAFAVIMSCITCLTTWERIQTVASLMFTRYSFGQMHVWLCVCASLYVCAKCICCEDGWWRSNENSLGKTTHAASFTETSGE